MSSSSSSIMSLGGGPIEGLDRSDILGGATNIAVSSYSDKNLLKQIYFYYLPCPRHPRQSLRRLPHLHLHLPRPLGEVRLQK